MTFTVSWTDERIAEARRYRREGLSMAAIAERMGSTRGAVKTLFFRLGKDSPRQRQTAFELIPWRPNNDNLHLSLLLAALREQRAA